MKLTTQRLKQLIKEELTAMNEAMSLEEQKQEILGLLATIGEPGSPVQDNGEGLLADLKVINAQIASASDVQQPLSHDAAMKAQFDASTNDGYNS
tara:strand:- start:10 stop:294 length:285 start_codon:yes stop_codon:yes gene_type:complete